MKYQVTCLFLVSTLASGCAHGASPDIANASRQVDYCGIVQAVMTTGICDDKTHTCGIPPAENDCISWMPEESGHFRVRIFENRPNGKDLKAIPLLSEGTVCGGKFEVPIWPKDGPDTYMSIELVRLGDGVLVFESEQRTEIWRDGRITGTGGTMCGVGNRGRLVKKDGVWSAIDTDLKWPSFAPGWEQKQ